MKRRVTREQFAKWSLEYDIEQGNMPPDAQLETLCEDEREVYLDEADYYLELDKEDWPNDVLERLKRRERSHA